MYLPPLFATDDALAWQALAESPFGLLIAADGELAPIPVLVDRPGNALRGHVARANPIAAKLAGPLRFVALGPHGYVSPRWYAEPQKQVPTWNYLVVEVAGVGEPMIGGAVGALVDALAAAHEGPGGWRLADLEPHRHAGMLAAIVGFTLRVSTITAKAKLSQNRSPEDHARVLDQVAAAGDVALAEWMLRTRPDPP